MNLYFFTTIEAEEFEQCNPFSMVDVIRANNMAEAVLKYGEAKFMSECEGMTQKEFEQQENPYTKKDIERHDFPDDGLLWTYCVEIIEECVNHYMSLVWELNPVVNRYIYQYYPYGKHLFHTTLK